MNDTQSKTLYRSSTCILTLSILVLFLVSLWQEKIVIQRDGDFVAHLEKTSLQRALLFDDPHVLQDLVLVLQKYHIQSKEQLIFIPWNERELFMGSCPLFWQGLEVWFTTRTVCAKQPVTWCEKIKQGEVWRLFSPALLHGSFWHLLFNLGWLWILGWRIEIVLGSRWFWMLVLMISGISNCAQYVMGGPFFLGFSGVIAGFAGMIWVCQRKSHWQAFSIPKATLLSLMIFAGGAALLEGGCIALRLFFHKECVLSIANTAHIVGFCVGYGLGKLR